MRTWFSAEDVQRMRVTPGLLGSFLIYIMRRSPTQGVGKYEEWLIKSGIRKRDASTDYALAIQPPQSSQHPFMSTPILLLVLFLFFLHATIFTWFVFILLPNMYAFFGLMSKSTFKLDITSNSFVVKAEPAGLVLDLHMDMYLVPAWCRSGRFQLHICKIFQNVHDVSVPIRIQPPNFPLLADVEWKKPL